MKSRAEVIADVKDRIRSMHLAYSTEDVYCGWIARYYDHCQGLDPTMAPEAKAESFLTYLAVQKNVAAMTQNQAFGAVLFLYKEVLRKPLGDVNALRAKKPKHERVSPSRQQVREFRTAVEDTEQTPARLIVDLLYGCGMRVSEPVELRIKDILWDEGVHGQFILRGAKGGKDRRVPIPRSCVEPLREQIERARRVWQWDRDNAPGVGVTLPYALAKKYPRAPVQWQWFWVFPAWKHCIDPRTQETVRFHILTDCIQRSVSKAAQKVGLDGFLTAHVLRHAYATHSRESLDALRELLGHSSLETTAGYLHPVVAKASNPLDDMVDAPDNTGRRR
jgi:integron integrase